MQMYGVQSGAHRLAREGGSKCQIGVAFSSPSSGRLAIVANLPIKVNANLRLSLDAQA